MKILVSIVYWPGWAVIKLLVTLGMKVEIVGREKLPAHGGFIIASNHLNNADPPVIGTGIRRRLVFMAKREAMGWPVVGLVIRLTGAISVRRFEADLGALRKAGLVLQEGRTLVMFPEGTRSKDAKLGRGHPGTALIALRTGTPIVPVAIAGTEQVHFPKLFFRILKLDRPRVKVVIGNPFFLPGVSRISAEEVRRCTDVIMQRIAALLPPSYRGAYAGPEAVLPEQPEEMAR